MTRYIDNSFTMTTGSYGYDATAGNLYKLSTYIKSGDTSGISGYLSLVWYDTGGNFIEYSEMYSFTGAGVSGGVAAWTLVGPMYAVAPADTTYVQGYLYIAGSTTEIVYIDMTKLEDGGPSGDDIGVYLDKKTTGTWSTITSGSMNTSGINFCEMKLSVHGDKVVGIAGAKRLSATMSSHLKPRADFQAFVESTLSTAFLAESFGADIKGRYYDALASSDLLSTYVDENGYLDLSEAVVTVEGVSQNIASLFGLSGSELKIRGKSLFPTMATSEAELPDPRLTPEEGGPEEGDLRLLTEASTVKLCILGSDGTDNHWWKIALTKIAIANTTGGGTTTGVPGEGGSCFGADMEVITPTGKKKFGDLAVGDMVLGWKISEQRPVMTEVTDIKDHSIHAYYLINRELVVTPEHYLVSHSSKIGDKLISANALNIGKSNYLVNDVGQSVSIQYKQFIHDPEPTRVRSISTDCKTYFIGKNHYYLAHNAKNNNP